MRRGNDNIIKFKEPIRLKNNLKYSKTKFLPHPTGQLDTIQCHKIHINVT